MNTRLDSAKIVTTVDRLTRRIRERFPEADLAAVCEQLAQVVRKADDRIAKMRAPLWPIRLVSCLLALCVLGLLLIGLVLAPRPREIGLVELIQTLEAAINDIILLGAAVFFLVTLEHRIKRRQALSVLHELRSLTHLVDLHQLTKDPERVLGLTIPTASSPKLEMTPFSLGRYLNYCSEMLALISVTAALYVERIDDPVVLAAAGELQELAANLSQKVWQKIQVLRSLEEWRSGGLQRS